MKTKLIAISVLALAFNGSAVFANDAHQSSPGSQPAATQSTTEQQAATQVSQSTSDQSGSTIDASANPVSAGTSGSPTASTSSATGTPAPSSH